MKLTLSPSSLIRLTFFTTMLGVVSGCASVGTDFSVDGVKNLTQGKTSLDDVRTLFGDPWRVGLENGQKTWTYGRYRYQLIGKSNTKDLVLRFDKNNIVSSYTFNSTNEADIK